MATFKYYQMMQRGSDIQRQQVIADPMRYALCNITQCTLSFLQTLEMSQTGD